MEFKASLILKRWGPGEMLIPCGLLTQQLYSSNNKLCCKIAGVSVSSTTSSINLLKVVYLLWGLISAEHRIELCHLAYRSSEFVIVDHWEANQNTFQHTLTVLHRIKSSLVESGQISGAADQVEFHDMLVEFQDALEDKNEASNNLQEAIQTMYEEVVPLYHRPYLPVMQAGDILAIAFLKFNFLWTRFMSYPSHPEAFQNPLAPGGGWTL